ncbi:MAG: tetratricopeptide repeat protein [Polyangiales bacterium]
MSKRLEMIEQMIAKGSDDPFHHYARAMELWKEERLEDALEAFRDVEGKFPEYVPTFLMAGQLAEKLGREDEARQWYERGIPVARKAGDAHAVSELEGAIDALDV